MTNEEAIAIIRNEYKCVDRDCDIERSCGKCDLMMPSKEPILEAYKLAIQALSQEPCDDVVSRQAVIDMIEGFIADATSHGISPRLDPYYVMNGIKGLPSVTQKYGKWIDYREDGFVECPFCGHATNCEDDIDELHYCFYCGAKMESEEQT